MNQPKFDSEMIQVFKEKQQKNKKNKKNLIVELKRTTNSPIVDAGKDESTGTTDETNSKYYKQDIRRANSKVKKENFTLRKKIFLRFFTDKFLSFGIYNRYDKEFEIILIHPINENNLHKTIRSFTVSIKAISLLGEYLPKKTIYQDCQDLVEAEAYQYLINILQDSKVTDKILQGLIRKYKPISKEESYFGMFARILIFLIDNFLNWEQSSEYLFNDISREDEKLIIIKNTIENFEQLDSAILNKELLKDIEVTKDAFHNVFLEEKMGDFLSSIFQKAEYNYIDLYNLLKYDFLVENFQSFDDGKKDITLISESSNLQDTNKLSLYYFSQGAIDGLTILTLIQLLFKREENSTHKRDREMIVRFLEDSKSNSDVEFIEFLQVLVLEHKFKNIIFIVYLARALCLSRREAFKLSQALGIGKETTFNEHYETLFSNFFPNHTYIK